MADLVTNTDAEDNLASFRIGWVTGSHDDAARLVALTLGPTLEYVDLLPFTTSDTYWQRYEVIRDSHGHCIDAILYSRFPSH